MKVLIIDKEIVSKQPWNVIEMEIKKEDWATSCFFEV